MDLVIIVDILPMPHVIVFFCDLNEPYGLKLNQIYMGLMGFHEIDWGFG